MQLQHIQTLVEPSDLKDGRFQKVVSVAWSPNSMRMAVATVDRVVSLFDEQGVFQEKFACKPREKNGPKNFIIRGLEFSPDSTQLAVAQSDNVVFVYRVGAKWGDKKSICNKFAVDSSVTALTWPPGRPNELVFGCANGKLKVGIMKQGNQRKNKSATLFSAGSLVASLASGPDGHSVVSGHNDFSVYRYTLPDPDGQFGPSKAQLVQLTYVPYALAWGESIVAAGNGGLVQFFSPNGALQKQINYSGDDQVKDFTCATFNPSGQTVVIGNFNRFYLYAWHAGKEQWDEASCTKIDNIYTITAARWKHDGSKLVTGSLCGAVDSYDACLRKFRHLGKFEFTYTSLCSVIVKRLASGERCVLESKFGQEITKITTQHDRYIIGRTPETLLVGDLDTALISEVQWSGSGKEKFIFDYPGIALVYDTGELSLIEHGNNDIVGAVRTEHVSAHLFSVALRKAAKDDSNAEDTKKIAFLLDLQAIQVLDLKTGHKEATINHDCKIDWLELNQRGTLLLFRDKRRSLHLFDIRTQERSTLLNYTNYAQWVPDSDVVVAQNRQTLVIWYNIHTPSQSTVIPIEGDVEQIERTDGRCAVIVDAGIKQYQYELDEALIGFGSAVDDSDLHRGAEILERMDKQSPEAQSMWSRLSDMALQANNFPVAERCFAALGDAAKARYLHEVNATAIEAREAANGRINGYEAFAVQAKLAVLNKQFKRAESILMQNGHVDDAIAMYIELHKWDEALAVARARQHPAIEHLRRSYLDHLLATHQEERAGQLKEQEGDFMAAINLYLRGGYPSRASTLVTQHNLTHEQALLERIAEALTKAGQFEAAGDFLERLGFDERAMQMYTRGHAYKHAVNLARRAFPGEVVRLEEAQGNWLLGQGRHDDAGNHFIEAGKYMKAVNAFVAARQFAKATQVLENIQDPGKSRPLYKKIAQQYEAQKRYRDAEKCFIAAQDASSAVAMYIAADKHDRAHKVAMTYMTEPEMQSLYVRQAQRFEAAGNLKSAEKLYIKVQEPDLAINMYKKNRKIDEMIALVTEHRHGLLDETHRHLAQQFEQEQNFKQAEKHYLKAGNWKQAVSMFRDNDLWDEVLRVAKSSGGHEFYRQMAYEWAISVGGDAGIDILIKRGLAEQAVDYAVERGEFNEAFQIAEKAAKSKLQEVHYQFAMSLEDEGSFEKAETQFVKAVKPEEAVEMYLHQHDYPAAQRVAGAHCPDQVVKIYSKQAEQAQEEKRFAQAEALWVKAERPDEAVHMYIREQRFDEARRTAQAHRPDMVRAVEDAILQGMDGSSPDALAAKAKMLQAQGRHSEAVDAYLDVSVDQSQDHDFLERCWETAVSVAMEHCKARSEDVVRTAAERLQSIDRHEPAAELCLSVDNMKRAVEIYVTGAQSSKLSPVAAKDLFDKATNVARRANNASWLEMIARARDTDAVRRGNVDAVGDWRLKADMLAEQDRWDEVFALLQQTPDAATSQGKYAAMHATALLEQKQYPEAVATLARPGVRAPTDPSYFDLYKRLAQEVLRGPSRGEDDQALYRKSKDLTWLPDGVRPLKDMLFRLVRDLKEEGAQPEEISGLETLLLVCHFSVQQVETYKSNLKELSCRLAISLLRYTKHVAVDRAFWLAGTLCREVGWKGQAFVFFNRFYDLCGLIDGDQDNIDNSDFAETDIPGPFDVRIPDKHCFDEDTREEANEWLLEEAVGDVDQELRQRHCDQCGSETFDAALQCHNCQAQSVPCIVSGMPIAAHSRVSCTNCKRVADKSSWNAFIMQHKTCPWCGSMQNPVY